MKIEENRFFKLWGPIYQWCIIFEKKIYANERFIITLINVPRFILYSFHPVPLYIHSNATWTKL